MAFTVKLALLIIIARVFGPVHRKTMMGVWCLIALLAGYYFSGTIVKICICMPVDAYWKGETDKCLNQQAIVLVDSIVSVISDLAILLLPVPLTWSLQMPRKKKLRVSGLLCGGGVATGFSVYRLIMIAQEGSSVNQTIVFIKVIMTGLVFLSFPSSPCPSLQTWPPNPPSPLKAIHSSTNTLFSFHSNAEVGIGLICACLPACSALFLHKGTTNQGSGYGKMNGSGSRSGFAHHHGSRSITVDQSIHQTVTSVEGKQGGTRHQVVRVEESVDEHEDWRNGHNNNGDDFRLVTMAQGNPRAGSSHRSETSLEV